LFVTLKVYTPFWSRVLKNKYMYRPIKIWYNISIVAASPGLPFPAAPRAHAHNTCHKPLMIGGNPDGGMFAAASGGSRLVAEPMVGITTPGCVRKTTRNVPAYP
jgi:hypothetical protein